MSRLEIIACLVSSCLLKIYILKVLIPSKYLWQVFCLLEIISVSDILQLLKMPKDHKKYVLAKANTYFSFFL